MTEEEQKKLFANLRQCGKTDLQRYYINKHLIDTLKMPVQKIIVADYIKQFGVSTLLYYLSEIISEEYDKKPENYLSDLICNLTKTIAQYNDRNKNETNPSATN